ncbi:phage portal protein [Aureimonas sp. ME7]|uniref:phage portal protein n=1 Tax=Aureimonas sp. ME7 TaxID=2744252 RepID=UPI0015F52629|nr:phage portal protein [Aureimonas sp. ME7]
MFGSKKKAKAERQEAKAQSIADASILEVFGGLPTSSGAVVNASTALQVPAVLQAVRLIAETVGSLPCKAYSSGSSKEAADSLPAFRLVHDRANPWTSAGQLRTDLTADALLHGAGYAQVIRSADGRPLELQRLPPTTVERRTESDGEPFYMVSDATVACPYQVVRFKSNAW